MFFNKAPNPQVKRWHLYFFCSVIIIGIGLKVYSYRWPRAVVNIRGEEIKVLVADTADRRFKGWGGEKSMGEWGGMLFVFPSKGSHAVVMRNMEFPLDIIWLDGRTIVDMAPNVKAEPGISELDLIPYLSRLPSTMVLEMPADFIANFGIKIGDAVDWEDF